MSHHTDRRTAAEERRDWTTNVQVSLDLDGEPVTNQADAEAAATAFSHNIVPTEHVGDGVWLVDMHNDLFGTLVEVGWLGIEGETEDGRDANMEAEWPE